MAFFSKLANNSMYLLKRPFSSALSGIPPSSQEVSLTQIDYGNPANQSIYSREAIYPQWFFSATLGQPRQVRFNEIRKLGLSCYVQMVVNTFKKQIFTTEYKLANEDEEDKTDYSADKKKVIDFLKKINKNDQNIEDIISEVITDIAVIDSGVLNLVYTEQSYDIGDVPLYDAHGNVVGVQPGLVLKPFGKRELMQVKSVDGATILKQVDIHKNLLNYWQYSFKNPRQNPTRFQKEEIIMMIMNQMPNSVYGFSPVQSIQQVLELLIQGTRYNKDLYTNNAIPDILISLPKLPDEQLKKLKRHWTNSYKGKPHQIGFINWIVENVTKLSNTNRDLEWLEGQRWYHKIPFAVYNVSPQECGYFENGGRSNDEGQERVTVRNALKPYYKMLENAINNRIIPEILQKEVPIKFKFQPKDQVYEKIEFDQNMQELDRGIITINEYRRCKGKDAVEWGDEPLKKPFDPMSSFMNFGDRGSFNPPNSNDSKDDKDDKDNKQDKKPEENKSFSYRSSFSEFLKHKYGG